MAISITKFWTLALESQVLTTEQVGPLAVKFSKVEKDAEADAKKLARWLVAETKISEYQAKILLAGKPGPFVYGDYRIYDRIESGRLAGIFRALHIGTKYPVCLYFLTGNAAQDTEVLARLAQQAAAANRISLGHPHLFALLPSGRREGL